MSCLKCGSDRLSEAGLCAVCGTPPHSDAMTILAPLASTSTSTDAATLLALPSTAATAAGVPVGTFSTASLSVGQAFGDRYHIIRQLGVGGMGVVYQAWDAELGVAVALKVIKPEVLSDPVSAGEIEKRFKRELVLARTVTHKNVVRIHDIGSIDGVNT